MKRFLAAFVALTCCTSLASANGRFPRAQRLVESAEDPRVLSLYGTYGLLVSRDGGRTWSHICEAATGPYTGEDPLLELLPGPRILARTETALVATEGSWCDWRTALDGSVETIQDITRDPAAPLAVLALVGGFDAQTGFVSRLTESADGGATWSPPADLPRDRVARGLSLDVAPSAPSRVVVTGLGPDGTGQLLVSDDRGVSWVSRAIPGTDSSSAPYLAQVSKQDPGRLFVRTDAYREIDFIDTASDALLLSLDAGATFTTVIERRAKLLGFALSPDESTLVVGYGDPMIAATFVEPGDVGIYRASVADILADPAGAEAAFVKIFEASVTCLRWTGEGLFACTSQSERGFEVGRATDASFTLGDTTPFEPLLRLPEVTPLSCSEGTSAYSCYTDPDNGFGSVCGTFQAPCDASPPPARVRDGGAPDSGALGSDSGALASSGGARDAPHAGGAGPGPGASGAPSSSGGGGGRAGSDGGSIAQTSSSRDREACACRTGAQGRGGANPGIAWAILVTASSFLRRRR